MKYAKEANERQAAHGALLAERERLSHELRQAASHEDASAAAVAAKLEATAALQAAQEQLASLSGQRRELLRRAATKVVQRSSGSLKATVKRNRVLSDHVDALCALLEGGRFRDPEVHCADWVARMFGAEEPTWPAACGAISAIYRMRIMAGGTAEPGADPSGAIRHLFFAGGDAKPLTDGQVARIYANLSDQSVGLLLSATAKDVIALTDVSDGRDIDFAKASPGQQASALLRLLLRQSAGTLIIDQPEDDLDNSVLMRIVEIIRSSKTSRQLIFATHNANLVVNGDADKVITMVATVAENRAPGDVAKISLQSDGAIETPWCARRSRGSWRAASRRSTLGLESTARRTVPRPRRFVRPDEPVRAWLDAGLQRTYKAASKLSSSNIPSNAARKASDTRKANCIFC